MEPTLFMNKTAVIGAGLMGSQIGIVLALGSKNTVLVSRRAESRNQAMENVRRYASDLHRHNLLRSENPKSVVGRITTTDNVEEAVADADLVIESISEDLEAKQALFEKMDQAAPKHTLLASNTSGLPISQLGIRVRNCDRIAGAHFVQPGHIVPVVEVIRARETSDEVMTKLCSVWERLDRLPIRVEQDIPGFLINRLQHAVIREAVDLLASGVADAESIDLAMQLGLAPRFTTAGPLEQRDINGLKMHSQVANHLWQTLGGWEQALKYLQEMVARGEHGLQSGKGYYDWSGRDPVKVRSQKDEELLRRTRQVMDDWHSKNHERSGAIK